MKTRSHSLLAIVLQLAFAAALTGCEGLHDAFNPEKVPAHVTESSNDVSSSRRPTDTVAAATTDAPRATRTSAAGSYPGDPDVASQGGDSDRELPIPTPKQQSGSRIRAKILITDDGARAFQGWHDSQRHEDCEFQRDAEGTMRCLPLVSGDTSDAIRDAAELSQFVAAAPAIIAGRSRIKGYGWVTQDGAISISSFYDENTGVECSWLGARDAAQCVPQARRISYYVDQAHTRLLIQTEIDSSSITPNVGEHYHSSSCTSDYYRSGEPYQGTQVFQRGSRDARPIDPDEAFYELGDPIDSDSFAMAIVEADTRDSGRLTALNWITSDGGAWFSHWYDNLLQTPCIFTSGEDPRCVPDSKGARTFYADAKCSESVAEVLPKNDCSHEVEPPRYVTIVEPSVAGSHNLAAYAVLSERTLTTRYQRTTQGVCEPQVVPGSSRHFDLGEPVPTSELAGGHVVIE
jgi:hypothetical protein